MRILLSIIFAVLLAAPSTFGKVKVGGTSVTDSNEHYLLCVRHMTVPFTSQRGATWDAGNDVSGKTEAEIQAIVDKIKALETDARQKEIYTRMKATPTEVFAFSGVAHAKAVVLQRLETIKMMEKFNDDFRYTYHDATHPPSTTAGNWEPGPRVKFFFRQKSGSAFTSIGQITAPASKTYGDCTGAIMACVWWGGSRGMLEPGFNGLYAGTTALDMDFETSGAYSRNTTAATDSGIHVPGDWLYFKNYNYKRVIDVKGFYKKGWLDGKRIYYWSGENALYVGGDKYEGLGVVAKTLAEMKAELVNAYNGDLATVITEVGKLGGTFGGLEIKTLTPEKIEAINVQRVNH